MKVAALKELAAVVGARGTMPLVTRGAYVNVIEGTERAMNAALREEQFALFRQLLEPEQAWVATVVPRGWLVRSALKVLSLGASASYRTFEKPREAAEWIAEYIDMPVDDLRAFVAWGRQLG